MSPKPIDAVQPGAGERILLGALTALIVARPLVAGDDPGRLRLTSGGGPIVLNMLTFLLLLGWAVWKGYSRRRLVVGPYLILPVGLLVVAAFIFISAGQPGRYQRPGWFIAWDWVGFAALAFVAGQLATNAAVVRGLIAVLIATAGCLAMQALYEETARAGGGPRTVPNPLPRSDSALVGDDVYDLKLNDPPPPRGTFRAMLDQPDSLAGLLLLIVPALAVWTMTGWRAGGKGNWLLPIAILLVLSTGMALVSWIVGAPTTGKGWQAALAMMRDHPALGVGPGNFSRNAPGRIASDGSFWMGFAATAGLFAMVVFAFALAAYFGVAASRRYRVADEPSGPSIKEYRWSFYLGGVGGLIIGMMLATGDLPAEASPDELLRLGAVSAGRSLAWFIIFAALEMTTVPLRWLSASLGIGVAAVALLGMVSDGLASPALMVPLVIAATLSLGRVNKKVGASLASLPAAWIGAPIAMAVFIANLVHVGIPGYVTSSAVNDARKASVEFPELDRKTSPTNPEHFDALRGADGFLVAKILSPLKDAARLDSGNSALFSEMVRWERMHLQYLLLLGELERFRKRAVEILSLDEAIARIDSRNPTPRFSEFEAMLFLLRHTPDTTPTHLKKLEQLVKQIVEYDPRLEVRLCYLVVDVLLSRRNPETADPWAVRLLRLDAVPGEPHGKLTDRDRRVLFERLKIIKKPSAELAQFLKQAR